MKQFGKGVSVLSAAYFCTAWLILSMGVSCTGKPSHEPEPPRKPAPPPEQPVEIKEEKKTPEPVAVDSIALGFDGEKIGEVPSSIEIAETASRGKLATWATEKSEDAPSQPNAFVVTETNNSGGTYNLALVKEPAFKDVDILVAVKARSGKEDQGGGPVWRAMDAGNYYIARWNPLEDNFRIYFVKDGKRKQLASTKMKLDGSTWHTIRIVMIGENIKGWIDGDMVLETQDTTFTESGMIGLWTKADAATLFDDLVAKPAEEEK